MTVTVVEAKQVWMPKPGKKFGSIVTPQGERFLGKPDQLRPIVKGSKVEIEHLTEIWGDSPVEVIQSVRTVSTPPVPAYPNAGATSSGRWQPKSLEERREIFIESLAGRAMGSGQFPATEMKMLVLAAADAWDALQARAMQRAPLPEKLSPQTQVYNDSHMPEPPASWEREHPGAH